MKLTVLLLAACHTSDAKQPRDSAEPMSCPVGDILDGEVCVPRVGWISTVRWVGGSWRWPRGHTWRGSPWGTSTET